MQHSLTSYSRFSRQRNLFALVCAVAATLFLAGVLTVALPVPVGAQAGEGTNQRPGQGGGNNKDCDNKKNSDDDSCLNRETKGGTETCGKKGGPAGDGNEGVPIALGVGCKGSGNPIFTYLQGLIPILTAGVGIVVVGAIIYGGIVYASARGDKNQTMEGVKIIVNAVIALVMFILMAAILEFLVPGGVV